MASPLIELAAPLHHVSHTKKLKTVYDWHVRLLDVCRYVVKLIDGKARLESRFIAYRCHI